MRAIELGQDVHRLGRPFLGNVEHINTQCLMRISDEQALDIIQPLEVRSKISVGSEWIRIVRTPAWASPEVINVYVERVAAQRLAQRLLTLPWQSTGYLVDHQEYSGSSSMAIFETAAQTLPNFINHLTTAVEKLIPNTQQQKGSLISALRSCDAFVSQAGGTRSYKAACTLQAILADLGNHGERAYVDTIVGILAITNSEFRDLMYDSLRSLRETTASLKVPKAFGVVQHFFVDWQEMFPEQVRSHEVISVSYTVVVLATVRALVKCEMLLCCPNARLLIDAVLEVGDVVYTT